MIIVRLLGGLGNQMFQYAAGRALSVRHNTTLKLDLTCLLDRSPRENYAYRDYALGIFNIRESFATPQEIARCVGNYSNPVQRWLFKARRKIGMTPKYLIEIPYQFTPGFLRAPADSYLDGYWQNEKYFKEIESTIRREFSLKESLSEDSKPLADQIQTSNSICLHVRRGDLVFNPVTSQYHGVCAIEYFMQAVSLIAARVAKPQFFIFSDDVEWCQAEMRLDFPNAIVPNEFAMPTLSDHFQLMTLCKHFIISNSSYSWWGAWLSENPNKIVIAPRKWLNRADIDTSDVTPPEWLRI
jgi:hypothetical protein